MKALVSNPWVVNAASAVVVALMVGVAAALGFRQRAKVDEAALRALAVGEGQAVEASFVAPDGSAGVAKLTSGALLIARAMADGVSARLVKAEAVHVQLTPRRVTIGFADLGFPPLHFRLKGAAPAWLAVLAQGG